MSPVHPTCFLDNACLSSQVYFVKFSVVFLYTNQCYVAET